MILLALCRMILTVSFDDLAMPGRNYFLAGCTEACHPACVQYSLLTLHTTEVSDREAIIPYVMPS